MVGIVYYTLSMYAVVREHLVGDDRRRRSSVHGLIDYMYAGVVFPVACVRALHAHVSMWAASEHPLLDAVRDRPRERLPSTPRRAPARLAQPHHAQRAHRLHARRHVHDAPSHAAHVRRMEGRLPRRRRLQQHVRRRLPAHAVRTHRLLWVRALEGKWLYGLFDVLAPDHIAYFILAADLFFMIYLAIGYSLNHLLAGDDDNDEKIE